MASSSSSSSSSFSFPSADLKRFHVFPSFHGPDVRRKFLSHLENHFASKGITMFKDQEIERGHSIKPELVKSIRDSRVSIVLLSENYASSSWCLDELVEIFKCKADQGQIVMTIFYDVNPSDVRKQSGVFGSAFEKTCQRKADEEMKQRWSKALTDVANIEGEHSLNWANEANMIQKIAADVSNKLNVTLSRDFDDMVGLQAHLRKMNSLLCLECDDVKMIGIWGPAGIGKTTIARALYNILSSEFGLKCFMGNLRGGSYRSTMGVDDYDSKLSLQNQLLSKILNQKEMKIHHLSAIKDWLHDQRVLIILDDVDDIEQLEILAKERSWFGPGSRIVVTTKDKTILKAHGINDIYNVGYPSQKEALEMLCLSAFKQSFVPEGFEEVASKVLKLCGYLPIGLCVVGSSLRGESKHEWEIQLSRIKSNLDSKIEQVLRMGYDRLSKKDQSLFLHIANFFNGWFVNQVKSILADSNLDVTIGLKTLADKSLVHIHSNGSIVMHFLLQQLGKQIVLEQSEEPGKRQFLVEAEDIRDVLANGTGTGSVIGIFFDMSKVGEFSMNGRAFNEMRNLQFITFYVGDLSGKARLPILDDMEYLPRLRLLIWESYPRKRLPPTFQPECLIELCMKFSKLEKLWEGTQPLPKLKKMDLSNSFKLKEIPNLSEATNLEILILSSCTSLVELPSSISNLRKLKRLWMTGCENLQVIPNNINLSSLEEVSMKSCSRLRSLPNISWSIKCLDVGGTRIQEAPKSTDERWSRLECLHIDGRNLERLAHLPESVRSLDCSNSDIERIPDCIVGLPRLVTLNVKNCVNLETIPALSRSLELLYASECVSLKKVCCTFYNPVKILMFYNCLKLEEEARRKIIQQSVNMYACLPGREIPAEFTHKATGNSITIDMVPGGLSSRLKVCLLLSPTNGNPCSIHIIGRLKSRGGVLFTELNEWALTTQSRGSPSEHLFTFGGDLFHKKNICHEVDVTGSEKIVFEFSCMRNDVKIIECAVQILKEEPQRNQVGYFETGGNNTNEDGVYEAEDKNFKNSKHPGCWSWLKKA